MQYDDLLGKSWARVETKNRSMALERAYNAGRSLAESALTTSGGSDILNCTSEADLTEFYFHYLIEEPDFYPEVEQEDRKYWSVMQRQDVPSDPRIHSFSQGWLTFVEHEIVDSSPLLKALLTDLEHGRRASSPEVTKVNVETQNPLKEPMRRPRRVS